nr:MAG TPA: hypothetical protein [Caudoviricetes sp.]
MSYIAKTAFELRVSNHQFDTTKNVTGLYQNASNAAEACSAGFLVAQNGLLPNEGYTGVNNENAWKMKLAATGAGVIYACNTFNVNILKDDVTGAEYKVGTNTLGLPIPAGNRGTYTRIDEGDIIRVGVGNFTAAPGTSDTVATIANGLVTSGATAPDTTGLLYFEILGNGTFTQGAYAGFAYYDLRAVRVTAVKGA